MARLVSTLAIKNTVHVLRAEKRISQQDLADAIGVTRATINAIEGRNYNPSLELAFRIAMVFAVPLEQVFFYDAKDESSKQ